MAGDAQTLAGAAAAECRGLRSAGTFACLLFHNYVMRLRGGFSRAAPTRVPRCKLEQHSRGYQACGKLGCGRQLYRLPHDMGVNVDGGVGLSAAGSRLQPGGAAAVSGVTWERGSCRDPPGIRLPDLRLD